MIQKDNMVGARNLNTNLFVSWELAVWYFLHSASCDRQGIDQ